MSITGTGILIKLILHLQVVLLLRDTQKKTHTKKKAAAWQFETLPRGRGGTTSPMTDGAHKRSQHSATRRERRSATLLTIFSCC